MLNLLDIARRLNSIKSKNYTFNTNYSSNKTSNNSKANTSNSNNKAYKNNNSIRDKKLKIALNTSNNYKSKSSNKTSKLVYSNYKKLEYLEKSCYLKYLHLSSKNKKTINNTRVSKKEIVLVTNSYNNKSITIDFILDSSTTIYTYYIKDLFSSITSIDSYIK
jgi:hypothetical protein